MNAILFSLVLLTQFDMSGPPADLNMSGRAQSGVADLMMGGDVLLARRPIVRGVMITAPWCPPCGAFKANEVPRLVKGGWNVGDKETDHLQLINAENFEATTLPTFIRMVDGKEVSRHVGSMDAVQLAEFIYPKKVIADGEESAPTPTREVERVLDLLPKPEVAFVDFGCGDGRWLFAAVERWGCKAVGVEIDPSRAAATRERVRSAGLSHLITIVTGNATEVSVEGDVAAVYLYADVLNALRPRLEKMRAVASYMHAVPGLPMIQDGQTWLYVRASQAAQQSRLAVWQGQNYSQPVCNSPSCKMCNSIRSQMGINPPPGSIWWSLLERK